MNTVCAAPSRQPRDGTAEFQSLEPGGNVSESEISELLLQVFMTVGTGKNRTEIIQCSRDLLVASKENETRPGYWTYLPKLSLMNLDISCGGKKYIRNSSYLVLKVMEDLQKKS